MAGLLCFTLSCNQWLILSITVPYITSCNYQAAHFQKCSTFQAQITLHKFMFLGCVGLQSTVYRRNSIGEMMQALLSTSNSYVILHLTVWSDPSPVEFWPLHQSVRVSFTNWCPAVQTSEALWVMLLSCELWEAEEEERWCRVRQCGQDSHLLSPL